MDYKNKPTTPKNLVLAFDNGFEEEIEIIDRMGAYEPLAFTLDAFKGKLIKLGYVIQHNKNPKAERGFSFYKEGTSKSGSVDVIWSDEYERYILVIQLVDPKNHGTIEQYQREHKGDGVAYLL